jgi:hypothetical protein
MEAFPNAWALFALGGGLSWAIIYIHYNQPHAFQVEAKIRNRLHEHYRPPNESSVHTREPYIHASGVVKEP